MQAAWSVICSADAVQRVKSILSGILEGNGITCTAPLQVLPYWKTPDCCMITCEYTSDSPDPAELQKLVRQVSGREDVNVMEQGCCVEYASYASEEEILSSNEIAFVVCFVNMKENVR